MDKPSSNALSTVPILQGKSNYREWALALEAVSEYNGFWPHLMTDTALSDLNTKATTAETRAEQEKIMAVELKARGAIKLTASDTIKSDIAALATIEGEGENAKTKIPTAYEIWAYLSDKYKTKDGVSALLDFKKFFRATLVDDGTLENQLNLYQELRSRCSINDMKVPDWQYASLILLALPDSFTHVQESFLTTGSIKDLKSDEVRARILETENRRKEGGDASSSNFSLSSKPAKGKKTAAPSSSSLNVVDKSNVECFYCQKKGHMANECRKKKRDKMKIKDRGENDRG